MFIAIIILVLAILALIVLQYSKKLNIKIISFVLVILMLGTTIGICAISPKMHKEFSLSIIDYLIKFNDDGSMSTTKQTTQTVRQRQGVQE